MHEHSQRSDDSPSNYGTDYDNIDPYNDDGRYVINRARLYRDRRDFIIQPGDTGKPGDYPVNLPRNHPTE